LKPVSNMPQLRAAIVVQGKTVVMADLRTNAASTSGQAGQLVHQ